jgi:methylase of polypeptide subunit release factors
LLECGIDQASDIVKLLTDTSKYQEIEVIKDFNGIERIIKGKKYDEQT